MASASYRMSTRANTITSSWIAAHNSLWHAVWLFSKTMCMSSLHVNDASHLSSPLIPFNSVVQILQRKRQQSMYAWVCEWSAQPCKVDALALRYHSHANFDSTTTSWKLQFRHTTHVTQLRPCNYRSTTTQNKSAVQKVCWSNKWMACYTQHENMSRIGKDNLQVTLFHWLCTRIWRTLSSHISKWRVPYEHTP